MPFVIYLSTENNIDNYNDYGYWAGKSYTHQGEHYPIFDREITDRFKKYKNKINAEKMAEKLYFKYGHVNKVFVEKC